MCGGNSVGRGVNDSNTMMGRPGYMPTPAAPSYPGGGMVRTNAGATPPIAAPAGNTGIVPPAYAGGTGYGTNAGGTYSADPFPMDASRGVVAPMAAAPFVPTAAPNNAAAQTMVAPAMSSAPMIAPPDPRPTAGLFNAGNAGARAAMTTNNPNATPAQAAMLNTMRTATPRQPGTGDVQGKPGASTYWQDNFTPEAQAFNATMQSPAAQAAAQAAQQQTWQTSLNPAQLEGYDMSLWSPQQLAAGVEYYTNLQKNAVPGSNEWRMYQDALNAIFDNQQGNRRPVSYPSQQGGTAYWGNNPTLPPNFTPGTGPRT